MDSLMNLINDPGPIRWLTDLVVIPLLVTGLVFGVTALLLRFGPRPDEDQIGPDFFHRSLTLLAPVLSLIGIATAWHFRFRNLAERTSDSPQKQALLVDWLSGLAMALLATVILVLLIKAVNSGLRAILHWLDSKGRKQGGVRLQNTVLITPHRMRRFLVFGLRIVRFAIVLLLLYVYIPLVLSVIPATRVFAERFMPMVLDPVLGLGLDILGYLPRLLSLVLIIIGVRYFLRLLTFIMEAVGDGEITIPGFDPEWADQTLRLLRIVVVLGTIMLIYPFLPGAGSDLFKGFSLFVGAVFTLGASSSVANVISGVILTYTRSFRLGDRVQIGETFGDVTSRGLFVTRIRTVLNEDVTVPNSVALGGRVVNYSSAKATGTALGVQVSAGIGYEVDWRRVHELMKAAALGTERILSEPEPYVLQDSLDDVSVQYTLVAFTHYPKEMVRTRSALRQNLLDQFNEAGIEIMTPDVTALRNSVDPSIPAEHAPDRAPSGLRILGPGGTGEVRSHDG
ncbi:MAG: mechanosensitive ion channel family protein [Gemmatimonadota bacterium]